MKRLLLLAGLSLPLTLFVALIVGLVGCQQTTTQEQSPGRTSTDSAIDTPIAISTNAPEPTRSRPTATPSATSTSTPEPTLPRPAATSRAVEALTPDADRRICQRFKELTEEFVYDAPIDAGSEELLLWQRNFLRAIQTANETYGADAHLLLKVHGEELEYAVRSFDGEFLPTVIMDIATFCTDMGLPSVLDN